VDPGTAQLYAALGTFLGSIDPAILAASRYLVPEALLPPVRRWPTLDGASRRAWWSMLRPALEADPTIAYRMLGISKRAPWVGAIALARVVSTGIGAKVASGAISARAWILGRRSRPSDA